MRFEKTATARLRLHIIFDLITNYRFRVAEQSLMVLICDFFCVCIKVLAGYFERCTFNDVLSESPAGTF
jgi:hypothetical protein